MTSFLLGKTISEVCSAISGHLFPDAAPTKKSNDARKQACTEYNAKRSLPLCRAFVDFYVAYEAEEITKAGSEDRKSRWELLRTQCVVAAAVVRHCSDAIANGNKRY